MVPVPSVSWKNQFGLYGGGSTKVGLILALHPSMGFSLSNASIFIFNTELAHSLLSQLICLTDFPFAYVYLLSFYPFKIHISLL